MLLHWLLALMITASFSVGTIMVDLPFSPTRLKLYNGHKWAGIVILGMSALRLLWRLTHRPPVLPPMARWQRLASQGTHGLLYALFFAVPLLGWAYTSAVGFPVVLFGVLPLPDVVAPDRELAALIKPWHGRFADGLALLVVLHVAAACKHHLVDRDGLLHRMLPRWKTSR